MQVDKKTIKETLISEFQKADFAQERRLELAQKANKKFNISTGNVMDYLVMRKDLADATDFDLFILSWSLDHMKDSTSNFVDDFFTPTEKRGLINMKIENPKIEFPIQIKCIQVDEEQWIGKCDVAFLMKLRESQMINYNENAQRTMRHMVRHGKEMYKVFLNRKAVRAIKESYETDHYIPNTITLNIPENEFDFVYDEKANELIINSLHMFDISDGYHRYIAMSEIWKKDHSFNYPMELRITHFTDDKMKQFIFQEDQKTKMRRIDSESMDMNAPANKVTERLNADPLFILAGSISRNKGIINYAEFSQCVRYFYFRGVKFATKAQEMAEINKVKAELLTQLNEVFATENLKEHYDFRDLMIIFTGIHNEMPKSAIEKYLLNADRITGIAFESKVPRKGMVTVIENMMKEEEMNA